MFSEGLICINSVIVNTLFKKSVDNWCNNSMHLDWSAIGGWIMLFMILLVICICFLSNKKTSRLLDSISNNLLIVSSTIWFLGVIIYLIGMYNPNLNWLSVIPRTIISSFKMFIVSNDLARVSKELQEDVTYMSVFSLIHFIAAFLTFLFVFKMIGYKIKSSAKILFYKWFNAKGKVVHLFWGINEASCLLAEDIRKHQSLIQLYL